MAEHTPLPKQFAFLEPFAVVWGDLRDQSERYLMRQQCSQDQLAAFHAALAPRLEEVFSFLDGFDPQALPEPVARLYRTVLGLTEVSQAVEIFGQPGVPHTPYPHRVTMEWVGYLPH
jgi:hypothetical protein